MDRISYGPSLRFDYSRNHNREVGLMESSAKYASFFLVFSILFSYFSYAFSLASTPIESWDLSIDIESLYTAGILLGEADELNVSWTGNTLTYYYFSLNNTDIRTSWFASSIGDRFHFQSHAFIFDLGFGWHPMQIRDFGMNLWNSTIVSKWNNQTKWSLFHSQNGYEIFFIDPEQEGNITRAVYTDGIVGVIIAESINYQREPNMRAFISWYANIVTGTNVYGLPPQFNVIIQLITALSILSLALIIKEMLRL